MSLRSLPNAPTMARPQNYQWDAPCDVLAKWAEHSFAAAPGADADATISIFDVIGEDGWTGGGVTAKRISAALRSIGNRDVIVRINSPGGDMFEGIAIYNLLRTHPAKVTVEVLGWAASAASIIAMAGDEIRMGLGTFIMVHKPWGMVVGTDDDFLDAADLFKTFTAALVDIYEARTGMKRSEIEALVAAETFMGPSEAVKNGFADSIMEKEIGEGANAAARPEIHAKRRLDALLAQAGVPRVERRRMLKEATGTMHDAAPAVTHDAGLDPAALQRLIATIRS